MTLVIIFGPPAAGKMTVGLELERLTGFRLFHNHMTVDPLIRLFPLDSPPSVVERHLKIDNTELAPDIVAARIVQRFELPVRGA